MTIGRKLSSPWISAEVGARARHELAGLQLVVAGEVEALQPLVDRGAQVVLHVEARPGRRRSGGCTTATKLHRPEADEQHEQRPERPLVGDDHVVDDRPLDERDERR